MDLIDQPIDVQQKRVHVVDAGLSFNLPFPAVLRPQRTVDLIISFDFGTRETDNSSPFQVISTTNILNTVKCISDSRGVTN